MIDIPIIFMLIVTLYALVFLIKANLAANPPVPPEPKKAEEPQKSAHH